ncbi:MAG: hypothetical protein CMJ49_04835 [Planctomycetaceae bacterium]|nr:hypothetical protein [Planctomycetaceae bacterium]
MLKKILIGLVALVVVLLIAGAVVLMIVDSRLAGAVSAAGTEKLGVETKVETVNVDPLRGEVHAATLTVANPPDYSDNKALTLGEFNVDVTMGSLLSDTVEVALIGLKDLHVRIEKSGDGNNFSVIMGNLKKSEEDEEEEPENEEGKKFIVRTLLLENITAVVVAPIVGELELDVAERIELNDVMSDNAEGLLLSELTGRIMPLIMSAVMNKLSGIADLPAELVGMVGQLGGDLDGVIGAMGGGVADLVNSAKSQVLEGVLEDAGGAVGNIVEGVGEGLGETVDDVVEDTVGEGVEDAADKVKEGIGNLFGE